MKTKIRSREELLEEIARLRGQIEEYETVLNRQLRLKDKLAHLATFPKQNPNLVIETNLSGEVTYLNPVAQRRFPELWLAGFEHPILADLDPIIRSIQRGEIEYFTREVNIGSAVFEQKICQFMMADQVCLRIFAHDITRLRKAEKSVQELAKKVVLAQEAERRRVSRELHDEAGQALTVLKISLELLQADLPESKEELLKNLGEAIALINGTRERIRLLARGLHPQTLDTLGLNQSLEELSRTFSRRTQIPVAYTGLDLPDLADAVNICLYRFLQEGLTNVARHAEAKKVQVVLEIVEGIVCLVIQDDGRGLGAKSAASRARSHSGMGLAGMQERLELLGGWLDIESDAGQGTRLVACLPLEKIG